MRTKTKLGRNLRPGDSVVFGRRAHRVTDITPYPGCPVAPDQALTVRCEGDWTITEFGDEPVEVLA